MLKLMVRYVMPSIILSLFLVLGFTNIKAYAATSYTDSINKSIDSWIQSLGNNNELIRDYSGYYIVLEKDTNSVKVYYSDKSLILSQRDQYGSRDMSPKPYRDVYYATSSRADAQGAYGFTDSDTQIKQCIKYTNFDFKNYDETVFFSAPIPPIAQAAEVLPHQLQPNLKVIMIVAVSCLALLIGLVVLVPKLVRRFLP